MGNNTPSPTGEIPNSWPMFYIIFVIVALPLLLVLMLIVQDLIQTWCTEPPRIQGPASSCSFPTRTLNSIPIFQYKKQLVAEEGECAVCLSPFGQGEELKRLPKCKHSFHAGCIDMWLHSHMDCPLCRSPVDLPAASPSPPAFL